MGGITKWIVLGKRMIGRQRGTQRRKGGME